MINPYALICLSIATLPLVTGSVLAQESPVRGTSTEVLDSDGDRPRRAIELGLGYQGEVVSGRASGLNNTGLLGNLNLRSTLDGSRLIGRSGLQGFVDVLVAHGIEPSLYNGDLSLTSNIEAPTGPSQVAFYLFEAWLEQSGQLGSLGGASLLVGIRDINSDFYRSEAAMTFFNSNFGMGTELADTGSSGPSTFPQPQPGARFKMDWSPSWYSQVAAFTADGGLGALEVGWTPRSLSGGDAKLALGAWAYALPTEESTQWGTYATSQYGLTRSLAVFANVGTALGRGHRFGWTGSAGLWWNGVGYASGGLGLGYFHLEHSEDYRGLMAAEGTPVLSGERGLELTYRAEIFEGGCVQPDLQYVMSAGGVADDAGQPRDLWVASLRLALEI